MEILFDVLKVVTPLLAILALYSVHRLNRKQNSTEQEMNRNHSEALSAINHAYSKEAHASNHIYTRKAVHLEKAGELIGELTFWAEKCVVPRTRTDFGSKQKIAKRMSMAFEDLSKLNMQYSFAFREIEGFQEMLGNLMATVNHIENLVNSDQFNSQSPSWAKAVQEFQQQLSPLANTIQNQVIKMMEKT
ncbi:TPA: hypothetical protein NKQ43_003489 [Vibrio parahaemolyticus]|nr:MULTISPECIES: hypothetical protein [Vibrio]AGR00048.1 hypothetical protein M636_12975 [Vibrio parahaemolyticus O1:K33 str. CDC_K4557]EGQ7895995.1 hypothetical protein [Vibrio parahaemolyticus]EGQ8481292.1 hypothetical protein [Vibrio parahaemolyticus]EGQ9468824.1 hypothetical protein [Vibrio parahaemolyticus]EGQ9886431.1 hypothetical protein [Vibrio parahaemolyticus]